MSALRKIQQRIRQKGLRSTLGVVFKRYVLRHRELLWMKRDLDLPLPPHTLRPYPPLRLERISVHNVEAFGRYFGDRIETMRELAAEGYTGLMYLDDLGNCVAFAWGSLREYHDRHHYGCRFPVKPGQYFQFGGEQIRKYWGTQLSADLQQDIWHTMANQGCDTVVAICESNNTPALKLHLRTGYREQGRITHTYCLFGRWKFFRESRYHGSRLSTLRKPAPPPKIAATISPL